MLSFIFKRRDGLVILLTGSLRTAGVPAGVKRFVLVIIIIVIVCLFHLVVKIPNAKSIF